MRASGSGPNRAIQINRPPHRAGRGAAPNRRPPPAPGGGGSCSGGRARAPARKVISYESIYRFIYAQMARTKDYRWRHYLPRGKSKRGFRGRRGGSSTSFIEGRVSLAERPPDAADRRTPGHWEADLMLFSRYGQAVLTVHERSSRLLLAVRPINKAAR